jgi:hypothetical protein
MKRAGSRAGARSVNHGIRFPTKMSRIRNTGSSESVRYVQGVQVGSSEFKSRSTGRLKEVDTVRFQQMWTLLLYFLPYKFYNAFNVLICINLFSNILMAFRVR